jgi:BON domain
MKHRICCIFLFLASMGFGQQQGQPPPTTSPPYQTPPTFPEGRQTPRTQMPPDTEAPPPQSMSTQQVEQQIAQRFSSEPELSKSNIDAKVDDNAVVLTGSVDTETQHALALRIARSYAGGRRIVDKVKVKQQT